MLPVVCVFLLAGSSVTPAQLRVDAGGQLPRPTFKSGVEVVRVTAIVSDRHGQPVLGLSKSDFELLVGGELRPIIEFGSEPSPVSFAILMDSSGSMRLPPKKEVAQGAVHHLLSWIAAGEDEVALYGFDKNLSVLQPFTTEPSDVEGKLSSVGAYGQTSLYDAIAETSQELAGRRRLRGAVIAVTDGVDTSSRLDEAAVSRLVSEIDVPVYVLAAAPPVAAESRRADAGPARDPLAPLEELCRSTGGRLFVVNGTADASLAARTIVSELRHQYLIGFEPGARAGWHPLVIRTLKKTLIVRARSGYVSGGRNGRP